MKLTALIESPSRKTGVQATCDWGHWRLELYWRTKSTDWPLCVVAIGTGTHPPRRDGYALDPYAFGVRVSVFSWLWTRRFFVRAQRNQGGQPLCA